MTTATPEVDPDRSARPAPGDSPTWPLVLVLMRHQSWRYTLIASLWLFTYAVSLIAGQALRAFFDALARAAPATPVGPLAQLGLPALLLFLVAAAIAREAARFAVFFTETVCTHTVRALLGHNLLATLLARPAAVTLPGSPGEAISRFRDDVDEVANFTIWAATFPGRLAFGAAALVTMIRISPPITLAALLPLVAVAATNRLLNARISTTRSASRASAGAVAGFLGDMFASAQALKVAAREEGAVEYLRRLNVARRRASVRERLVTQTRAALLANSVTLSTATIVLLAGSAIVSGAFTVGVFAMFVFYLGFLTEFVGLVGMLIERSRQMRVAFQRLVGLTRGAEEQPHPGRDSIAARSLVRPAPVPLRGPLPTVPHVPKQKTHRLEVVETFGLTYRFPKSARGIVDVSFRLERGTFTVVTGRVGAGKSTLLRVLLGLLPRDSGEIGWNGAIVAEPGTFFVPPRCAYVPQVLRLFSDTVRENILLGLPDADVDLPRAVRLAVLDDDLSVIGHHLENVVGQRGTRLSGGQAQRVAAARAFVADPELLVVDDLSSALDVTTERVLWERLASERGEMTCLAASHRRPALQRADQILLMQDGALSAAGTIATLLASSAEFRRLWHASDTDQDASPSRA